MHVDFGLFGGMLLGPVCKKGIFFLSFAVIVFFTE